jgi:hypothetical protein
VDATGEMGPLRVRIGRAPRLTLNGTDVSDALIGPDDDGVRTFGGVA